MVSVQNIDLWFSAYTKVLLSISPVLEPLFTEPMLNLLDSSYPQRVLYLTLHCSSNENQYNSKRYYYYDDYVAHTYVC